MRSVYLNKLFESHKVITLYYYNQSSKNWQKIETSFMLKTIESLILI